MQELSIKLWLRIDRAFDHTGYEFNTPVKWLGIVVKNGKIYDYDYPDEPYEYDYDADDGDLTDWVGNEYALTAGSFIRLDAALTASRLAQE